ncbi:hypothetical protein yrohd0001_1490 [Yersinia rohdei ATCC 43380]|nr:hypothetical protein yrohd0001_1490 [Yersinia rohdei ATCC 43380]
MVSKLMMTRLTVLVEKNIAIFPSLSPNGRNLFYGGWLC